ncbi:acetolactate synthase 2 small subunit [Shewanella gelidii]|nr:acetolactate synthase 2 small subunit [Shewanella gelidii]MCL1097580.1 acetolactate synthase 2 small subunit [Shewanella gelidii]
MIHALELELHQRPEVLERILRVARHRGFKIIKMNMRSTSDVDATMELEVDSERTVDLLSNQLTKLVDVTQCRVLSSTQTAQTASL